MLPIPIRIERDQLPADLRRAAEALNGARPGHFTLTMVMAWVVIFAAIAAAQWAGHWWATLLAIVVVATRMNILGLLVHDQVHRLGYRNRFGDLIVNAFCAWPLIGLTVEGYAQVHLAHHRDFFGPTDPDHQRKSGPEWQFPKRPAELLRLALRDVTGLNFVGLVRGKRAAGNEGLRFARPGVHPAWARPVFMLSVIGLLVATGTWPLALLYWLLPLVTVFQLIVRWGAVCEHEYNRPGAAVTETTPLIELSWWEQLLLPNLNFSLHLYHHYFPGVACSQLPAVHRLFKAAGLVDEHAVFKGHAAYLRHLLQRPAA